MDPFSIPSQSFLAVCLPRGDSQEKQGNGWKLGTLQHEAQISTIAFKGFKRHNTVNLISELRIWFQVCNLIYVEHFSWQHKTLIVKRWGLWFTCLSCMSLVSVWSVLGVFFLPCYLQSLLQNYLGRGLVWGEK